MTKLCVSCFLSIFLKKFTRRKVKCMTNIFVYKRQNIFIHQSFTNNKRLLVRFIIYLCLKLRLESWGGGWVVYWNAGAIVSICNVKKSFDTCYIDYKLKPNTLYNQKTLLLLASDRLDEDHAYISSLRQAYAFKPNVRYSQS